LTTVAAFLTLRPHRGGFNIPVHCCESRPEQLSTRYQPQTHGANGPNCQPLGDILVDNFLRVWFSVFMRSTSTQSVGASYDCDDSRRTHPPHGSATRKQQPGGYDVTATRSLQQSSHPNVSSGQPLCLESLNCPLGSRSFRP
jgi:hypothetical protein